MSEIVTLQLPEHVVRSARAVAVRTHRRVEEVLVDWIDQAAAEVPVESLSDAEILGLCDTQLADQDQKELSRLLARNREGQLSQLFFPRLPDDESDEITATHIRLSECANVEFINRHQLALDCFEVHFSFPVFWAIEQEE